MYFPTQLLIFNLAHLHAKLVINFQMLTLKVVIKASLWWMWLIAL